MAVATTVGAPTTRSGKRAARFARGERGTRVLFFTDRTAQGRKGPSRERRSKDKEGKTIYEEEQRSRLNL